MPNPLSKNKVIEFIKRYPHTKGLSITDAPASLAVAPGNPTTPSTSLLRCNVGKSGREGNPSDFSTLIQMWLDPVRRQDINPFGLMRLWAAAYRTYYDWVKQTRRAYPNPDAVSISVVKKPINPLSYKVEYESPFGTVTYDGNTLPNSPTIYTAASGSSFSDNINVTLNGKTQRLRVTESYPQAFVSNLQPANVGSTPWNTLAFLYGSPITMRVTFDEAADIEKIRLPVPYIDNKKRFLPTPIDATVPWYNFSNLEASDAGMSWFYWAGFTMRTSADGFTYNKSYKHMEGGLKTLRAVFRNGASNVVTSPDLALYDPGTDVGFHTPYPNQLPTNSPHYKTNTELGFTDAFYWYVGDDVGGTGQYDPKFRDWSLLPNFKVSKYDAVIKTLAVQPYANPANNNALEPEYILPDEFQVGELLPVWDYKRIIVRHVPSGQDRECHLTTFTSNRWVSKIGSIPDGANHTLLSTLTANNNYLDDILFQLGTPANRVTGRFYIHDITANKRVASGNLCSPIFPLTGVKTLELTSGLLDTSIVAKYLTGFPYIRGTLNTRVIDLSPDSVTYVPDFTLPYWTNNSPEAFTLGADTFSDAVAARAFQLTNQTTLSNLDKWKLLPYTLPSSSALLDEELSASTLTITRVPTGFDLEEDYLDNRIIPLPDPSDLAAIATEASARGQLPEVYYMRQQFSEFLYQLVNYCRSTCLKFWRFDRDHSVLNYKNFRQLALQYQNESQPFEGVLYQLDPVQLTLEPNPNLGTYEIADADIDIELSRGAADLWFLSGGAPSRVDVDIAVLQRLLNLAGVTL